MTFEELTQAFAAALPRAGLRAIPSEDVQLDLRTLTRTARFRVFADRAIIDPIRPSLTASARVELRWDALHTARQETCEEDVVARFLGPKGQSRPRTQPPWVRADLRLSATVTNASSLPEPGPAGWRRWRADLDTALDAEPIIDLAANEIDSDGNLRMVGWQGEPEAQVLCAPDGSLRLIGVQLEAWQALTIPRKWDDSGRRPDRSPDIEAMLTRWARGLELWVAALHHLET